MDCYRSPETLQITRAGVFAIHRTWQELLGVLSNLITAESEHRTAPGEVSWRIIRDGPIETHCCTHATNGIFRTRMDWSTILSNIGATG